MRQLILCATVALLLVPSAAQASNVMHFGNDVEFSDASSHGRNYLLGSKINVPVDIELSHAGIIFKDGGYNAKVGIYDDVGGHPNSLVAETGAFAVAASGRMETPFLSTPTLSAGDYWFMAVYDENASVGRIGEGTVDYISHTFENDLPNTFPTPTTYTGGGFNYYLVGGEVIPEPSTLALLGMAAGGLLVHRRRRRR